MLLASSEVRQSRWYILFPHRLHLPGCVPEDEVLVRICGDELECALDPPLLPRRDPDFVEEEDEEAEDQEVAYLWKVS